jgi:glycerol-3-phosphate dehydrogenase
MSKGSHIVVPGDAIKSETGVIIKTDLSVLFIIPWFGKWIVGTTDTDYTDDPSAPLASREDVTYIINQANRVLEPKLSRSQVIGVFAGLRPLVSSDPDSPTTELSREHVVDHPVPGFVTIAGGKYTTYRIMAEDAVDSAVTDLKRIVPDSCTESLGIVGADGYSVLMNRAATIAKEFGLEQATVEHLLNRHGSLIEEVLAPIKSEPELAKPLTSELPYLRAEIRYAVTHEGARSIDDVLSRRTRINFESKDQGLSVIEEVADLITPSLGWSKSERSASIEDYRERVAQQAAALAEVNRERDRISS